jgi:hypothetical protein
MDSVERKDFAWVVMELAVVLLMEVEVVCLVLLGSLLQLDLDKLALLVLRGFLVPFLVRLVRSEIGQLKLLVVSKLVVGRLGSLQMRLSVVVILCLSRIALMLFSLR